MRHVSIREAEENFHELVAAVERGETILLERSGKTVAELIPSTRTAPGKPREVGFFDGKMNVPDDFDTMCQDEIIALFEGR